ncbi:MAG: phage tail protein [Betaproteobacteria bacterium]|nr:phage tail protein [Betaproteobacteria bacterium]
MTQIYYGFLTNTGLAEWANAEVSGLTVPLTHIAIGDGNGNPVVPSQSMTALVHEVHRLPITSITADPANPGLLKCECVLLPSIGGWTIRELGLIGGNGGGNKLLGISNFPPTPKPVLAEGVGSDILLRMSLIVSNTAVVNLTIDPTVVVATNQAIVNAVFDHEAKANPHPQYILQTKRGAVNGVASLDGSGLVPMSQMPPALATDVELAAAIAAHLAAADPHAQYAADADLAAHNAAADPHPQYATDADLTAHNAAPDPHPQYATDADLLAAFNSIKPLFHKRLWRTR